MSSFLACEYQYFKYQLDPLTKSKVVQSICCAVMLYTEMMGHRGFTKPVAMVLMKWYQ